MNFGVLDIGGSKVKSALVANNEVLFSKEVPTPIDAKELSESINTLIKELLSKDSEIAAITIGVPGLVDYQSGEIINCPNIKLKIEKTDISVPILIANDADLALIGEMAIRKFQDESVALLTLGTGVGGAFSLLGKRPDEFAYSGEIGHMKIVAGGRKCSCTQLGCLEAYSSGKAILAIAKERISQDINSVEEVFDSVRNGNERAKEVVDEMARMLGIGIANLVNIMGVENIFLAGRISKSSDLFLDETILSARSNIFQIDQRKLKIEKSRNIEDVAMIGGAIFAKLKISR